MFFDSAIYPSDDFKVDDDGSSEIQRYYSGATVFITGGTGFIGKLLTEKLLRTCRNVNKIYLLIRPKKKDDCYKRLEKLFDECIFEKVRNETCLKKVAVVRGDLTQKNLGLDEEDLEKLIAEVTCVFHVGATVRFDESLRDASFTNVRATWCLLDIARQMKNLKSFVHVSTAFSFCVRPVIDEVKYQTKVKAEHLMTLVDALDDDELLKITPVVLGNWPNTYSFTKAVAEDLIVRKYADLPLAIVRPSVVSSTAKEPLAGWTDNFGGITGIVIGILMGVLHVMKVDLNRATDVVPADYVVNNIIAIAWDVGNKRVPQTLPVYNYVSSNTTPLILRRRIDVVYKIWEKIPSVQTFYHPFFVGTLNDNVYIVLHYIFHIFFGYVYDLINVLSGKRAFAVRRYKKVTDQINQLAYFTSNHWTFTNFNTQRLWNDLSTKDKQLFNFDMSSHNWDDYTLPYAYGLRVYMLKDPMETVPEGMKKWRRLKIVHYSLLTLLVILAMMFLYSLCLKMR